MKIAYASDIHTELDGQRELVLPEPVNVLVLAGDVGKGANAIEYGAKFLNQASHVVQIAGNHEYWKGELKRIPEKMREAAAKYPNLHFLENESVEIDGWWFHGATAWTDFKYGANSQALNLFDAANGMNDFKYIKFNTGAIYRKLKPADLLPVNQKSRDYLFDAVAKAGPKRSVVVSHHAPCHLSIVEKFKAEPLNHCYVNQWGDQIAYNGPAVWIHGHLHDPSDYVVGDTRVMCNPIGYPGQYSDTGIKVIELVDA